jgi:hypothetical protein
MRSQFELQGSLLKSCQQSSEMRVQWVVSCRRNDGDQLLECGYRKYLEGKNNPEVRERQNGQSMYSSIGERQGREMTKALSTS